MSEELESGKLESEELELKVIDLGDAMVETRQPPGDETPDCMWTLSYFPTC